MACQYIYNNNRVWFYFLVMVLSFLVSAIFLTFSFVYEKESKYYNLRKIFVEIGYTFLGTALFTIIAILYEVFKGEDPEILNIIRSMNNESSVNMTFQNDLSPPRSLRSTEVIRNMRENVDSHNRVLERTRFRTHLTESGTRISRLDSNHTNQVPQVNRNITQELSSSETVETSTQPSEVGNDSVDTTSFLNDLTVTTIPSFTSDSLESALASSSVGQQSLETADLGATGGHPASSESFNAARAIRNSSKMVDFKTKAAVLFKSSPVNPQNFSHLNFHSCHTHIESRIMDFNIGPTWK